MSMMNFQASFFAVQNPILQLERCFNKPRHRQQVRINQRDVEVSWTERAQRQLGHCEQPLIVELQLYFSCVVKKRVLFHRRTDFETIPVNRNLQLAFHPIASAVCDPHEFAAHYPTGKALSQTAQRMVPRRVEIDYRRGNWEGRFAY